MNKLIKIEGAELKKEVIKILQTCGQNMVKPDFEVLITMLKEDLEKDYPYLDWTEVQRAFHNGVRKRYGDFFGINVTTFCTWIDDYLLSQERRDYVKSKIPVIPESRQLVQENELSETDKRLIMTNAVNKTYFNYLADKKHNESVFLDKKIKTAGNIINVNYDLTGILRRFLVSEKLITNENITEFFEKNYRIGKTKIYDTNEKKL